MNVRGKVLLSIGFLVLLWGLFIASNAMLHSAVTLAPVTVAHAQAQPAIPERLEARTATTAPLLVVDPTAPIDFGALEPALRIASRAFHDHDWRLFAGILLAALAASLLRLRLFEDLHAAAPFLMAVAALAGAIALALLRGESLSRALLAGAGIAASSIGALHSYRIAWPALLAFVRGRLGLDPPMGGSPPKPTPPPPPPPPATVARLALAVGMLLVLAGCHRYVVRDARTYEAEIGWHEQAEHEAGLRLREFAHAGRMDCPSTAKLALTLLTRGPYHAAQERYLAGLIDVKPGGAPSIPPVEPICGTSTAGAAR